MTTEETVVGRVLDALVAKEVFGLTARTYRGYFGETLYLIDDSAKRGGDNGTTASLIGGAWETGLNEEGQLEEFYGRICPAFSSDIAAAWTVAEEIIGRTQPLRPWGMSERHFQLSHSFEGWEARIVEPHRNDPFGPANEPALIVEVQKAASAPLAICLVALQALGK